MKKIAELLPEGLTEATLDSIAALVNKTITEQVEAQRATDNAKVSSFLRLKVDEIKKHALTELSLENDAYRNASLFEDIKSIMSLEINSSDEESSTSTIVNENKELIEELEVLSEEFSKLLTENDNLLNNEQALLAKIENGQERLIEATDQNELLLRESQESSPEPFASSEKAIVITENVDKRTEVTPVVNNEFLTPEVVAIMSQPT